MHGCWGAWEPGGLGAWEPGCMGELYWVAGGIQGVGSSITFANLPMNPSQRTVLCPLLSFPHSTQRIPPGSRKILFLLLQAMRQIQSSPNRRARRGLTLSAGNPRHPGKPSAYLNEMFILRKHQGNSSL